LGTDVDRDDVGTLLGQAHCVASALPARGSGNKGNFAFHTAHVIS
jgi:hypothetical protein